MGLAHLKEKEDEIEGVEGVEGVEDGVKEEKER